jgi:hypothetical protein
MQARFSQNVPLAPWSLQRMLRRSLSHAMTPGSQILPALDLFRPTFAPATPSRRYAVTAKYPSHSSCATNSSSTI